MGVFQIKTPLLIEVVAGSRENLRDLKLGQEVKEARERSRNLHEIKASVDSELKVQLALARVKLVEQQVARMEAAEAEEAKAKEDAGPSA